MLPLVAIPTTTGTGSESTTICVLDVVSQHVKTGISHSRLRPTLAVVDPELTLTQPAGVTAASGLDILCHALESYTARPFTSYEHKQADQRVPYCGANPIADMWSEKALSLMATSFRTAVRHGDDLGGPDADGDGRHVRGSRVRQCRRPHPARQRLPDRGPGQGLPTRGYDADHAMVPHGMAVSLSAPAAFRFTFDAAPDRHVRAAELLAPAARSGPTTQPSSCRPCWRTSCATSASRPGLAEVGFDSSDIGELVEGTMMQQRLLATAPREVREDDIATILQQSIELW